MIYLPRRSTYASDPVSLKVTGELFTRRDSMHHLRSNQQHTKSPERVAMLYVLFQPFSGRYRYISRGFVPTRETAPTMSGEIDTTTVDGVRDGNIA